MPELPEVETIKRELRPKIINQRITGCKILRRGIIGYPKPQHFCKMLLGQKIIDVTRRGKYLILILSNNIRVLFHLRLSGAIIVKKGESGRFTRLIIKLKDCQINFEEPRALGRVYLLKDDERPKALANYFNLSPDVISPEHDFNYFKEKISSRKAMIKRLLLDQRICAGVGNIYSDEALFRAGIRPLRRANSLKTEEIFKLLISLKEVLNEGIENFGTTVSDYKRTDGKKGDFQKFLYVYSNEDKPCRICGARILLKKIGSRSTRYCPKCQK